MYVKETYLYYINILFEEKSFKRIHTLTYLLGWGEMVLKYFLFSYIFNIKNDNFS